MNGQKSLNELEAAGFPLPFNPKKVSRIEVDASDHGEGHIHYIVKISFSQEYRMSACYPGSSEMRFEAKSIGEAIDKARIFLTLL